MLLRVGPATSEALSTGTAPCGQFRHHRLTCTAKNSKLPSVALNSNDNSLTGFTSLGPTDDGRTKRDLIGRAASRTATSESPRPASSTPTIAGTRPGETTDTLYVMCGTSMSTPARRGIGALVLQQWFAGHGSTRPTPHTVKAILVHTATDLGNAGPDFSFGWGAVGCPGSGRPRDCRRDADHIHVRDVAIGETSTTPSTPDGCQTSTPRWPGTTLRWIPSIRLWSTDVDSDSPSRRNRPHAVLPGSGRTVEPCPTGDDSRNNVEMVEAPAAEGTLPSSSWGGVALGPQQYTLVTPEPAVENPAADCRR